MVSEQVAQFLAELTEARAAQVKDLAGLNRLFTASETGKAPLTRWEAGGPF
jgi:gas vesicle GvpC-like protein